MGFFKGSRRGVSNRKWSSWFLTTLKTTASLQEAEKHTNIFWGGGGSIVYFKKAFALTGRERKKFRFDSQLEMTIY